MNKSIYTEYANLTPYHIKWLDECGATWGDGTLLKDYPPSNTYLFFNGLYVDKFSQSARITEHQSDYTHLPTGDAFCQGVAGILGIEYGPEKPFTRKLINKLELHDKMERPLPEGTISKTETVTDDKGLAIDVKLLSEKDREWLKLNAGKMQKVSNAIHGAEKYQEYVCYLYDLSVANCIEPENFGYAEKEFYESKGVCITTDPTEFIRYVADKTGKEWEPTNDQKEWKAVEKPPLGLTPKYVKTEERKQEILEAMNRYNETGKPIPEEWVKEYDELSGLIDEGSPTYPHKTYRVLDSLDGVPFDKRIPLSEWVPPFGKPILYIEDDTFLPCSFEGISNAVLLQTMNGIKEANLDGHWMRIV